VAATAAAAPARAAYGAPKVPADGTVQLTRDASFLVFTRREAGGPVRSSVWLADLAGHHQRRLVAPTVLLGRVEARTDGLISVSARGATRLYTPRGGVAGRYRFANPFWSPDARHAVFFNPSMLTLQLWPENTILAAGGSGLTNPTWSPAGDRIAYVRQPTPTSPWSIVVAPINGALSTSPYSARTAQVPVWSADGRALAFAASSPIDAVRTNLFVGRADATDDVADIAPAFSRIGSYVWSPDGTSIAFTGYARGRWALYAVGADGTMLRQLATHVAPLEQLAWNGRVYYAGSSRACSRIGIFASRPDGNGAARLTNRCHQ
jgi:hypothetical protein